MSWRVSLVVLYGGTVVKVLLLFVILLMREVSPTPSFLRGLVAYKSVFLDTRSFEKWVN